ncbi:alpha/beta fold hydrolase [Nocardioides panaciterrulae]|uniref:Pimeloyl-ACP methyl ester carboxylesterase n=1 Tax=Nocardioides panaciterrulae TaxID=661492 RepID=A0A7Y9JCD8_9ACTN|nr:pimeloyl-ACP methyl ester carboxylesterase [Nocardioides panaciterrulae]
MTGSVAALLLVAVPFIPVEESAITGAVLCGFALGWTVLLLLSQRFTDQPQRWAAVPALVMGLGGLLLLAFGSAMREVLSWVWPPLLLALVVWMVVRVRRDMGSRGGRVQLYLVFTILALCAVGGGWQTVREAADPNPYLGSGRLIDVGGYQLRLACAGSGSPTVVLEPGAGGTSASMGWIAPAVAAQTRVCVYDRAGRGGSQAADRPQDGARIATDLHTLLHRAGVSGPYVLAGHSFGGLYVRIFAAHYPHEVAGLVLIDSTASSEPAESVIPSTGGEGSYDAVGRVSVLASLTARVGLTRLYGELAGGSLPARSEEQLRFDAAQAATVRSTAEEYLRAGDSCQEAASLRDFGDKPLVVITAGGHPASWMTAQNRTTTLSANSVHRVIPGASHQGLLDERQYAVDTAQAILNVVDSSRSGQPLRP